jgi:hypothetical protein
MTTSNDPVSLSQWISAGAAVIQTAATVVLVCITAWYVRVTRSIAEAAKRQAEAAQQSARLQSNQWEADQKMSAAALASSVHTALDNIRIWNPWLEHVRLTRQPDFPTLTFVPSNADDAVRFAGLISGDIYSTVTRAFDRLRRAEVQFGLANVAERVTGSGVAQGASPREDLKKDLASARQELEEVDRMLKEVSKDE